MIWKLLSRQTPDAPAPRTPPGAVVYAIGDVHGQGDLIHDLLQHIISVEVKGQASERPPILIGLGDYIDRGPHSKYVIEVLISLRRYKRVETHFLCGNHEDAMLSFLDGRSDGVSWLDFGGAETLLSYGVTPPSTRGPEEMDAVRLALREAAPEEHLELLRSLEKSFTIGDYFFAHAGAAPGVALADQAAEDLMWIRGPFLNSRKAFEKVVVHGHSPAAEVHADFRRIGIDTGAYVTGTLTALRLEDEGRLLVQAVRDVGGDVSIRETPL